MAFARVFSIEVGGQHHPLLGDTKLVSLLTSANGDSVRPTILAKIEKGGFFQLGENWTYYRRNYFSIACSFTLEPETSSPLYLYREMGEDSQRVLSFAMLISAGHGTAEDKLEPVELIQHGPQIDNGSTDTPSRIRMRPQGKQSNESYIVESKEEQARAVSYYIQGPETAVFERLQFKKATANNDRRTKSQQYFRLVVELWAIIDDVKQQSIKIATRTSVPLVIRGRSPRTFGNRQRTLMPHSLHTLSEKELRLVSGMDAIYHPELAAESSKHIMVDQDLRGKRASPNTRSSEDYTGVGSPRLELAREFVSFQSLSDEEGNRIQFPAGPILGDDWPGGMAKCVSNPAQQSTTIAEVISPTGLHPEYEDNSSISSVSGLFTGSKLSSASSIAGPAGAADQLVFLILGDSGLKALCTDGFAMLDADGFERILRLLLEIFSADLRRKAFQDFEVIAARYVKARVRYVASAIRRIVDPNSSKKAKDMKYLLAKTIEKEELIEKYPKQPYELIIHDAERVDAVSNTISSEDQDEKDPSCLLDMEQVKEFLGNGDAFEELREGLMGFIIPILVGRPKHSSDLRSLSERKTSPPLEKHVGVIAGIERKMRVLQGVCHEMLRNYRALSIIGASKSSSHFDDSLAVELAKLTNCLSLDVEGKIAMYSNNLGNDSARLAQENELLHLLSDTRVILEALHEKLYCDYTRRLQKLRYQHKKPNQPIAQELKSASATQFLDGLSLVDHNSQNEFCSDMAKLPNHAHQASKEQFPISLRTLDDLRAHSTRFMAFHENLVQETPAVTTKSLIHESSIPIVNPVNPNDPKAFLARDPEDSSRNQPESARLQASIKVAKPNNGIFVMLKHLCIMLWRDLINKITRPGIRPGYRRIEWLCDCGEPLWGDFNDNAPQTLTALSKHLNNPTSCASTDSQSNPMVNLNPPTVPNTTSSAQKTQQTTAAVDSTSHHQHPLTGCRSRSPQIPLIEKYLELCINTGEYNVTLAEIEISTAQSHITSDGQLFHEIRKQYNQHRRFSKVHNLHLFKPVEVRFVQFCLEDGDVGILKTPLSLPLEEDIRSREWEFCPCPCPLKEPPPIPNNIFLHHLNSKRTHPRSTWLNRLPKKLNHSIHQNPDPGTLHVGWQAHGWGIQIIEGPNERAVLWLTGGIVLASLAAALLWAFLKRDVQGAFGIGSFIVASASTLVFAFFNYHHRRPAAKP